MSVCLSTKLPKLSLLPRHWKISKKNKSYQGPARGIVNQYIYTYKYTQLRDGFLHRSKQELLDLCGKKILSLAHSLTWFPRKKKEKKNKKHIFIP